MPGHDERKGENKMKNKKAFTLIELLVVVLIIGILAAIAVPQYQVAVAKARYTELMPFIKQIKTEQEAYFLTNGNYASNCVDLGVDIPRGFQLNANKQLENTSKHYTILCSNGRYSSRVAGIMQDINGSSVLSVEQFFDRAIGDNGTLLTNAPINCWAGANKTYQKVCKSYCGSNSWNVLNQTTGAGWCSW